MKTQEERQKQVQRTKKIEEGLSYSVEVRDKEGRVLQRISAPSRSYVQAYNKLLNIQTTQVAKTVKDITGTNQSVSPQRYVLNADSAAGATQKGMRVGKGSTAVAIDDYALETPLEEGVGVDEFNHGAYSKTVPAVIGTTSSWTYKRIMLNNSGATISGIREVGIYVWGNPGYYLAVRDVLPSAVYVPHGGSITVIYTIPVTV